MKTLLRNGSVFLDGRFRGTSVLISDGVIAEIAPDISASSADFSFELNNCFVLPGLADVHVHLREPGFSYKETIASGTAAAARGGYTVLCAMPNLSPVPDSPEHLAREEEIIRRDALVRVLPYAAITVGEKGETLVDFAEIASRVAAFSDDGRGVQSAETMERAMRGIHAAGSLLAAHCEDNTLLRGGCVHDGEYARARGLPGICSESEWRPIERDIELVRRTGCRYHVCHVSSKESVELIRRAKREKLPVTCETAPHYLVLCDADMEDDGKFKMNPPLRSAEDRAALREGVRDGTIDVIATDHAPHSQEEKSRGLRGSLMGVSGLEAALPVLYTELVEGGEITMERLAELMSIAPRRIFGLGGGEIRVGARADLAVFDPRTEYAIDPGSFLSKGKATPFEGRKVRGKIILTIADGRTVWTEK